MEGAAVLGAVSDVVWLPYGVDKAVDTIRLIPWASIPLLFMKQGWISMWAQVSV